MTDASSASIAPWDALLADLEAKCPSVPTLTDADFEARVLSTQEPRQGAVVLFMARNCPYCAPAAEALQVVAEAGRTIFKLDAQAPESAATVARFAIGGFPTILLFRDGKLRSIFRYQRTPEMIEAWLTAELGPLDQESDRAVRRSGAAVEARPDR